MQPSPTGMRLYYDTQGHRLYLIGSERDAFRRAAEKAPREVRTYCHTLLYTGCRPSEALALTANRVDFQAQAITFESRKKRRPGIYRAVPVSGTLLDALDLVHGIRDRGIHGRRDSL
jgi:integrase/recombinase XerD